MIAVFVPDWPVVGFVHDESGVCVEGDLVINENEFVLYLTHIVAPAIRAKREVRIVRITPSNEEDCLFHSVSGIILFPLSSDQKDKKGH